MKRKVYIDMAKGIGIFLVIFGHAMSSSNKVIEWQCTFFMPLFFILSGLTYNRPKKLAENAKKILLPYYIGGGTGLILEVCLLIANGGFTFTLVVQKTGKLLLATNMWNYPVWFLAAFFICKIVFDYIVKISKDKKYSRIIQVFSATACFIAGVLLAQIKKQYSFFYPFRFDIGITMVPFMLIGFYLQQSIEQVFKMHMGKKIILTSVMLMVNMCSFMKNTLVSVNSSEYGNPIFFLLGAISGSLFVIFLCQLMCGITVMEKVLSWLGRNSLVIMCTHAIVLAFWAKFLLIINQFVGLQINILDYIKVVGCIGLMVPICLLHQMKKEEKCMI